MTDAVRNLFYRRIIADVSAIIIGVIALATFFFVDGRMFLFIGIYGLLLGTSTAVVTYCLTQFTGIRAETASSSESSGEGSVTSGTLAKSAWQIFTGKALESDSDVEEDTGWLIGRLENIIVLTLVIASEYTALSIIFAAKSWVRSEDTASENTTYYLAGTLVNFTYSIIAGIAAVWVLGSV